MKNHWYYFLLLEKDLAICSRYVDFSSKNYNTYSHEFTKLYLATCSEIDVVLKRLCSKINPNKNSTNINHYREIVLQHYPNIHRIKITLPRHSITLTPWENWINDSNPKWWSDYNLVKHHRDSNFQNSSLINIINSLSALMVVILYAMYYEEGEKGNEVLLEDGAEIFDLPWLGAGEPGGIFTSYSLEV